MKQKTSDASTLRKMDAFKFAYYILDMKRVGLGGKKVRKPLFPDISSYWSRHTWATLAAELDIPIDTISEALGHEHGCKTTQIYVNFNQKKVDEANRMVIDYVNSVKNSCK